MAELEPNAIVAPIAHGRHRPFPFHLFDEQPVHIQSHMKTDPFLPVTTRRSSLSGVIARIRWGWCAPLLLAGVLASQGATPQTVHSPIQALVAKLAPVGPSFLTNRLNLSLGLPLRNHEDLTNLLHQQYDPASTNFHHFLTSEQFAKRFGPTQPDYDEVVNFAREQGLEVTALHPNRTLVSVRGTVAEVERVFHLKLNEYRHPTEARMFFAPDREPSVRLGIPLLAIGGLDNFVLPRAQFKRAPAVAAAAGSLTGSGPNGSYVGNDFRAAYCPGVALTGTGQTVGLLEFDSGYYQNDITAYETLAGLPNVPVRAVLLEGYSGAAGDGNAEVSLDIEMAIAVAPGLKQVLVYEGSTTDYILNRMATDDLAKQIGASWTYPIDATTEQIFLQFAAQGQSFFNASGDLDAYPGAVYTPADDPNITVVGGTTLTTTGPGGPWAAETVWNWGNGEGSSGGSSATYPLPDWQQGISMLANQGSITMRNLPDVALIADNVYVAYGNGQTGVFGGTSCATPLWAGFIALVNELALINGEPTVGFINPAIYGMGKGSNALSYTSLFHDVTTGDNESPANPTHFSAVPGYDLCIGWGTPQGSNLVMALALPEALRIWPMDPVLFTGPVGGPFSSTTPGYALTDNGSGPVNWMADSPPPWFSISTNAGTIVGGPSATVTLSVTAAATNLPAGSYEATLWFTNLNDQFVQGRQVLLDIVTPPVILAQPTNQALLVGMTAQFSVSVGANALMFFQWREKGTNLSDGGLMAGTATSTLTVSNVTPTNVGSYSVVVSNAAGVLASADAQLTIVSSPPVIVLPPTDQNVLPGAPVSFQVAAVGDQPYSYCWQLNGTNLIDGPSVAGATSSTLTLSNVATANFGVYSVIVSNAVGYASSTGAGFSIIPVTAPRVSLDTPWSFSDVSGGYIDSPLVQGTDGNFYGTAAAGGDSDLGSIFKWSTNGLFTNLYSFGFYFVQPAGGLCQGKDNNLYGTAAVDVFQGNGATFKITTDGLFSVLSVFDGLDGSTPLAGMMQAKDGNFYGTTEAGGAYGYGTVYQVTTSGTLTTLVSFGSTNGAYPSSVLVQGSDGDLYGTTAGGGTNGLGTVFKITPAGLLTSLHSFSYNDGATPYAGLIPGVAGEFYGVTYAGGTKRHGTIFQISAAGELTTLYSFAFGQDGGYPMGGLLQAADGNLYGTTQYGGTYGCGTVFQMAPDGALNTLAQFDGYNGAYPAAALIQADDGSLYGTTQNGGAQNLGAIFRIVIGGPLQITGQPEDQSAYAGETATFTVATSGATPVSYRWQQNGVNLADGRNISGSATATLRITKVTLADAALYSVVVSNAGNSVTSDGAALEVLYAPPIITAQPVSQTCVAGVTARLTVEATGNEPLSYQWRHNGTNLVDGGNLSGSTSGTLVVSGATIENSGSYAVTVSSPLFGISSHGATLTVVPATSSSAAASVLRSLSGGNDGAFPYAGLIQGQDGNLYGMTEAGSAYSVGTIYEVTLAGEFRTIYDFGQATWPAYAVGGNPHARLAQGADGNFYGATAAGGSSYLGILFEMYSNAPESFFPFRYLYSFTGGADGAQPLTGLTPGTDGNFYGAAQAGGADFYGTLYSLAPTGAVTPRYEFANGLDGSYPDCNLVQGRDGNFYGTTAEGGRNGYGTVFGITTNGALTTLAAFDGSNGANPGAGVIQGADGNLYGTTQQGGAQGYGTVFRLQTNGTLITLCSFGNTNGSAPQAELAQGSDGNLYGTCSAGGVGGQGTVFQVTTNGVLTTLLWFNGLNGANPAAALVQASDGNFYGTTPFGGNGFNPSAGGGYGTIYRLTVPLFTNGQCLGASAIAGRPYSGTLAGRAVAPGGDTLTFTKTAGPAWLEVATDGLLAGTPDQSDIGTNVFTVSLMDANGVSASATLIIKVAALPLTVALTEQAGNLVLGWSGGVPPYQVQFTGKLVNGGWQNLGNSMTQTNLVLAPTNAEVLYRIQGQ